MTAILRKLPDDLIISRVDRRPSADQVPFRDVYFLEVQSQQEPGGILPRECEWEEAIVKFIGQVRDLGLNVDLIGRW